MSIFYLIPPLAVLGFFTWRKTRYGLYCILATIPAFLFRVQIWFVPTTWLELAIYTVALISIIKHWRKKTLLPHWYYALHKLRNYVLPIAVLFISLCISVIVSTVRAEAFGIVKAWFFDPIIFGILFIDIAHTRQTIRKCIYALSLSALTIALYGIGEYILGSNMTIPGRLDSFFSSPNYAAMYLAPLAVLFAGYAAEEYRGHISQSWFVVSYKIIWFISILLAIALTKSFGGWFGLTGGAIALVIFQTRVNVRKILIGIACFGLITALGFFAYARSLSHYNNFFHINSLQARKEIWINALALGTTHPFFGIGLGNFQQSYSDFIASLPQGKKPVEKIVLRPHNVFLDFWLETGLIGLIAFSWILAIFFKDAIATVAKKQGAISAHIAALFALILHGMLDTPYFKNDLSMLFWFIVIGSLALRHGGKSQSTTIV